MDNRQGPPASRAASSSQGSISSLLGPNLQGHASTSNKKKLELTPEQHRNIILSGQALVAVVNDPRNDDRKTYFGWRVPDTPWQQEVPTPLDPARYPPVSKGDLQHYLRSVDHGKLGQFRHDREVLDQTLDQELLLLDGPSKLQLTASVTGKQSHCLNPGSCG